MECTAVAKMLYRHLYKWDLNVPSGVRCTISLIHYLGIGLPARLILILFREGCFDDLQAGCQTFGHQYALKIFSIWPRRPRIARK